MLCKRLRLPVLMAGIRLHPWQNTKPYGSKYLLRKCFGYDDWGASTFSDSGPATHQWTKAYQISSWLNSAEFLSRWPDGRDGPQIPDSKSIISVIHNQLVAAVKGTIILFKTVKGHKSSSRVFLFSSPKPSPNQVAFAQLLEPDAGMILQCCYIQHTL